MRTNKAAWSRGAVGFLWIAVVIVVLICGAFERFEFDDVANGIRAQAKTVATEYAGTIARRLFNQFTELEFIAISLLAPRPDGTISPSPRTMHALFRFMALHPSLYAFNVQSPDGNRIIWSTIRQPKRPITMASGFTPLPAHAGYLLGRPRYASRVHSYAITMRYRAAGADGRTRYFVGTPYRLDRLFAFPNHLRTPLLLSVIDLRTHTVLATWRSGRLDFDDFNKRDTGFAEPSDGKHLIRGRAGVVLVPGLPLEIAAGWPRNVVFDTWVRTGRLRWAVEALFVGVMVLLVLLVDRGRRRERRAAEAIERLRTTDEATGLSTRTMFEEQISALCDAVGPGRQLAVIVIDIDSFTEINDKHGRKAGNRILHDLAQRLRALPDARLLARVGADSFAFVHVGILEREIHQRIDAALAVVEMPFGISPGVSETLKLSLGSALYPADTESAAALLGRAEVSIFGQIQRQNGIRRSDLDPYSPEYHAMLRWGWRFLNHLIPDLAAGVFDDFVADERNIPIMQSLDTERVRRLEDGLRRHVAMLLDPALTRERHRDEALRVGRMHVALGVDISALTSATSGLYQRIAVLSQQIPGRVSQRQIYLDIILKRCEFDMETQQDAAARLRHEIHRTLGALALETRGLTRGVDVCDAIIGAMETWPFIAFSAIYTEAVDGLLVIEAESAAHRATMNRQPRLRLDGRRLKDLDGHPVAEAWLSGEPVNGAAEEFFGVHDADGHDQPLAGAWIQSAVALPITDIGGRVRAILVLFGRMANQFSAPVLRDSLEALSLIAARGLEQARDETLALLPAADRQRWRSRLFDGGLQMFMQPIIDLRTGRVVKVEALARLELPGGQLISPGQFLPILSQQDLDRLFIEGMHMAMKAVRGYRRLGIMVDLSVNLPPTSLRNPDCLGWIQAALETHDFDPKNLTLELLEDQEIGGGDAGLRAIEALHRAGVQLALDDLGAGYGSLMRLRNLPFDMVKVDQGLVRGISENDDRSMKLVEALVELARRLDIPVTVEGLETLALIDMARRFGAEFGQGYGIARPMRAVEIPEWITGFRLPTETRPAAPSYIALY